MDWSGRALPVPPPSDREPRADAVGLVPTAVRLVHGHNGVIAALCRRSPADFQPLPTSCVDVDGPLSRAIYGDASSSLVGALAPLVAPRLERLVDHLRRRLARERMLLPVHAVRELDPTCLRRNARLPGATLIEKAGARQKIVAVRRAPRFDTMENRVLVAAAERLDRLASRPGARLVDRHAAGLRRLSRACRAVLARPELEGVGRPRGGDQPSNALLGDADYRAAWRAWNLVRREDDRFAEEWQALAAVWAEMLLLAAWSALATAPSVEALPDWTTVRDHRVAGGRLQTGGPRRWIQWIEPPVLITVHPPSRPGEPIRVVREPAGAALSETALPTHLDVLAADDREELMAAAGVASLATARAMAAAAVGLSSIDETGAIVPLPGLLVGASALDAVVILCDERGARTGPLSAASSMPCGEDAPLLVVGRPATWTSECAGPTALHGDEAELGGALLGAHAGHRDTAVVVPDGLDEAHVTRLRRQIGRAWLVWSPIAAVLALPDGFDPGTGTVAVVVLTDAALDVAVLECQGVGEQRLWIRSSPLPGDARGRELRRFPEDHPARRVWLRDAAAPSGWGLAGSLERTTVPGATSCVDAVLERLSRWRGAPPTALVVVGLDATDLDGLTDRAGLVTVPLHPNALATGARRFLERHHAGRPTWKDRLPALDLVAGRERRPVPLVPRGRLVAPGDSLVASPPEVFVLPRGERRILLDLRREDHAAPFALLLDGPPLPLAADARVRIRVRYTWGLGAMEGERVPAGNEPFSRIPFAVESQQAADTPVGPPPLPRWGATSAEAVSEVRRALSEFDRWWQRVPLAQRKEAARVPGKLDADLKPRVQAISAALRDVHVLDAPVRALLESDVAPALEWLLGIGSRRGAGEAPVLKRELLVEVVRCRANARIRQDRFLVWLDAQSLAERDRLYAYGRTIDGRVDATWERLVEWPAMEGGARGEWGRAITNALKARPDFAAGLSQHGAQEILRRAVDHLEAITDPVKHREAIYRLASVVPWVCAARTSGALPPSDAVVMDVRQRLESLYEHLPSEVRKFSGREAVTHDGPIAVAIAWLAGRYEAIPGLEDT